MTFEQAYDQQVCDLTLLNREKAKVLFNFASLVGGVVAELGVYKGGSALLLARAKGVRLVHLYDTFEGVPESEGGAGVPQKGDFASGIMPHLTKPPFVIFKGRVEETTKPFGVTMPEPIYDMVHIDCDIGSTCAYALDWFARHMTNTKVIVIDDYGFPHCPNVKPTVDLFVANNPEFKLATFVDNQAVLFCR
jgi:hypothetical protein